MNREYLLAKVVEESEGDSQDVLSHVICSEVTELCQEELIMDYE